MCPLSYPDPLPAAYPKGTIKYCKINVIQKMLYNQILNNKLIYSVTLYNEILYSCTVDSAPLNSVQKYLFSNDKSSTSGGLRTKP